MQSTQLSTEGMSQNVQRLKDQGSISTQSTLFNTQIMVNSIPLNRQFRLGLFMALTCFFNISSVAQCGGDPCPNPDLIIGPCENFDVILILDESGSINDGPNGELNENLVREATLGLAQALQAGGGSMAIVEFSKNSSITDIDGAGPGTAGYRTVDADYVSDLSEYLFPLEREKRHLVEVVQVSHDVPGRPIEEGRRPIPVVGLERSQEARQGLDLVEQVLTFLEHGGCPPIVFDRPELAALATRRCRIHAWACVH